MKRLQAYLTGTFIVAAVLGSTITMAQDTIPQRQTDSAKIKGTWDRNTARSDDNMAYTYIDLNTGDTLDYWYDADKKIIMNRTTNLPVDFYINTTTRDTVYGRGRFVVNGLLLQGEDGKWKFDESKVKIDGDELKIKDGKRKLKIDGDEIKVKDKDGKIKSEGKEVKVKTDDMKAKIQDDEMKVKDKDGKAKYKENKTKIKEGDTKIKRKQGDSTKIKENK